MEKKDKKYMVPPTLLVGLLLRRRIFFTRPRQQTPATKLEQQCQCLTCMRLWQIEKEKKKHTVPPTSLVGQLLWREMFYASAVGTPNFGKMEGNPICKQVGSPLNEHQFCSLAGGWRRDSLLWPIAKVCVHACLAAVLMHACSASSAHPQLWQDGGQTHLQAGAVLLSLQLAKPLSSAFFQ